MAGRTQQPKSRKEQWRKVIAEYREAHGNVPYKSRDVAIWAQDTGRAGFSHSSITDILAREISEASREEYYTDPQGRRVRKKHAVRVTEVVDGEEKQLTLWDDIETATPEHMRTAL